MSSQIDAPWTGNAPFCDGQHSTIVSSVTPGTEGTWVPSYITAINSNAMVGGTPMITVRDTMFVIAAITATTGVVALVNWLFVLASA